MPNVDRPALAGAQRDILAIAREFADFGIDKRGRVDYSFDEHGLHKFAAALSGPTEGSEPAANHPIFAFLDGSAAFEGVWFGDKHPTRKGAFWWRSVLREALATPTAASQSEMLKYYSDHANVLANEALQYQARIRELENKLAAAASQDAKDAAILIDSVERAFEACSDMMNGNYCVGYREAIKHVREAIASMAGQGGE